jgi:hypothetical protein
MAAWTTSGAPNVSDVNGLFKYTNGYAISKWHLKHGAYNLTDISAQWSTSPALILSQEEPGAPGVKWKKHVKQVKYRKGTSQVSEIKEFWLPVLFEGDPVRWLASKIFYLPSFGHGTNTTQALSATRRIFFLPLIASNSTIADVIRVGEMGNSSNINLFSPKLNNNTAATGSNAGTFVASYGDYDYYWQDTDSNPEFVKGEVSGTGATVTSSSSVGNPFVNTIFVGNKTGYKAVNNQKIAQLYTFNQLTVAGKTITKDSPFTDSEGTQNHFYSEFAVSVGKLSPDPDSFIGKVPVVVDSTTQGLIQGWKKVSQIIPVKPTSTPLYAPNAVSSLPLYMGAYSSLWQQNIAGFTKYTGLSDWQSNGEVTFAENMWIIYPTYFVGVDKLPKGEDAAKANWFASLANIKFPTNGQHFGIFNNATDANAWVAYWNALLLVKQSSEIKPVKGRIFVVSQKYSDSWEISFNPDGLSGLVSQNSLLANVNQGAAPTVVTDEDVDVTANPDAADAANGDAGAGGAFRVTMQYAVNTVTKKNVNLLIKQLMANEKLTFTQTKEKFIAEFIKARTAYRVAQGTPLPEAQAIANARAATIFANASPNTNPGGAGNAGAPPPPSTIRIPIVRGLIGYQPPPSALGDSPQLVQKYQYTQLSTNASGAEVQTLVPTERRFVFPFVPKDVTYSNLSSVWTEINRTGRHPIVDWTGFQLLKVSFTFELVARTSTDIAQPRDGFGLYFSVDEQINILRQMATAPYPVSFLNMDTFFSKELRYPLYTQGRGVEFVITDFAVQSVQRTVSSGGTETTSIQPNQISRASCTITLQECPIEQVDIISIPKITVCSKDKCPAPTCKEPCTEKPREFVLQSPLFAVDTTPAAEPATGG